MTNRHDSYLWYPSSEPDAEIAQLERLLKPLSANALHLANRDLPLPAVTRAPLKWKRWMPLAAAAMIAGVYFVHVYRLNWTEGSPWPVVLASNGTAHSTLLNVDETITTSAGQTATLSAARIGKVVVAENSAIRLVQSQMGKHRVELKYGRLHAKIWAPPNYFRVSHDDSEFVDMGCEFDLQIDASARGTLSVSSGWVFYSLGNEEILVPEQYSMMFDGSAAQIPVRTNASVEFRSWVNELASQLESNATNNPRAVELAQEIAASAQDEDYYTLHVLLRRFPQLALGPLYSRLAAAMKVEPTELHRTRWASGDRDAMNEWWQRWPKQPKQWWLNWRDAF